MEREKEVEALQPKAFCFQETPIKLMCLIKAPFSLILFFGFTYRFNSSNVEANEWKLEKFLEKLFNSTKAKKSVFFGTESISSLVAKIWDIVSHEIKNAKSIVIFKEKIKLWKIDKCACRFCKRYIGNAGFI